MAVPGVRLDAFAREGRAPADGVHEDEVTMAPKVARAQTGENSERDENPEMPGKNQDPFRQPFPVTFFSPCNKLLRFRKRLLISWHNLHLGAARVERRCGALLHDLRRFGRRYLIMML